MSFYLENKNFKLVANNDTGMIEGLYSKQDLDGGNVLISTESLKYLGFEEQKHRLLGSTIFGIEEDVKEAGDESNDIYETGRLSVYSKNISKKKITYVKKGFGLEFTYYYTLLDDGVRYGTHVKNITEDVILINRLAHWIPIAYIYGTELGRNLTQSWSMVPSLEISKPYMICKKRNGKGPDYIIINTTGGMKSVGSVCSYKNLFYEKASPSLSGVVLYNAALCWEHCKGDVCLTDWPYKDLYKKIKLAPGEQINEIFEIRSCEANKAEDKLISLGTPIVDFQPYTLTGKSAKLQVRGGEPIGWKSYYIPEDGDDVEVESEYSFNNYSMKSKRTNEITVGPFLEPGERKVIVKFADGQKHSIIFPVYSSMKDYIEAICSHIYNNQFISDHKDPNCYGYRSISPQGESCVKGSILLLKNSLSSEPNKEEIKQVEINTVKYIIPNWLNVDLMPKRKHGNAGDKFVRMYDIEYIIIQLYLLGICPDHVLSLNRASYYIKVAANLLRYRIEMTPEKNARELDETNLAMACHWDMDDLLRRYANFGYKEEAKEIKALLNSYIEKQKETVYAGKNMVTEICFDNAGIAMSANCLLSAKEKKAGLKAANLLLANVALSNDYRCFAPDRWWEAQAPMYHNLWASNVAKAMLQAYEAGGGQEYLTLSYRTMMPLFYNYDWTAKSSRRILAKGEGVSTYCITAPNLNFEPCSRNRFGQQIFVNDSFVRSLNLQGDDWDNGVDLIIYLQTFGQKCYVDGTKDNPYVVGGQVEKTINGYIISSFSAYPSCYQLKPWNMCLQRSSNKYTIDKIEIVKEECTKVFVKGEISESDEYLWLEVEGNKRKIYPKFIKI